MEIRKNLKGPGLGSMETGGEQSPDSWHKTDEFTKLSRQQHCPGE